MDGPLGLALFAVGWASGWVLLARPRPLPATCPPTTCPPTTGRAAAPRPSVTVIVPARDEAASIATVVATVMPQLRGGDDLLVVDDHSTDATASLARAAGARVVVTPPLPPGWAGKPHACHVGACHATGDVLVFLDADVTLGAGALDALLGELSRPGGRDRLVSVQPWHRPGSAVEQLQLLCNVVALMGSAAFTVLGTRIRPRVAFGPVVACTREGYARIGGHAHPDVRGAILEDVALGRRAGDVRLFTGRAGRRHDGPATTAFRMYPGGLRPMAEGWTKGLGIGAGATPTWAFALVAAWIASLAAGWVVSPWLVVASVAQLAVLGRVAGRWSWWAIVLFPLPLAWFLAITWRSGWRRLLRRDVSWKGRRLTPDQPTR